MSEKKTDKPNEEAVALPVTQKPKIPFEEAKKVVLRSAYAEGHLSTDLDKLANDLLPRAHENKWKDKKLIEEVNDKLAQTFLSLEVETHVGLMEGFPKSYRGMAGELSSQIIKEYGCGNHAEKMLAESAVGAFMRYLDASRRLNNCLDVDLYITPNKTAYMAMLSKERDRAHRQFLTSLATVKQFKAPAIEMNIKANTAFVSQNQQINVPPTQP